MHFLSFAPDLKMRQARNQQILSDLTEPTLSLDPIYVNSGLSLDLKIIVYSAVMNAKKSKSNNALCVPTAKMIGKRLAEFRKKRRLSQSELSKQTGVAQNMISEYEAGKMRMHGELIARFAIALDVSADEMLALDNLEPRAKLKTISSKVRRRAEMLEDLPPSIKKHALRTIDMIVKASKV